MIRMALLTAEFCMPTLKLIAVVCVVEISNGLETLGPVTIGAVVGHSWAMRVHMAHLAIGVLVVSRHIFKNLVHVTGQAGHLSMLASESKVGVLVVVELDP